MLIVFSVNLSHLRRYAGPECKQWYEKLQDISRV